LFMIISPPLLKTRESRETDAAWIERVMAEDPLRGFPVNRAGSWHGGIHIRHTDSRGVEKVRAIADGTVVSFRPPSGDAKRDQAPLNLNADNPGVKGSDDGYVLLRHETETGSGDDAKVVFYSLYMHLKSLRDSVKSGTRIYRKEAMGTPGMADAVNAIHFQIFCDDDNISKLTGRKTRELDVSTNGRTDAVYGDIHFYLPAGTKFYSHAPKGNALSVTGLAEVHTSTVPLYVSMTLEKGSCTMVTRQQNAGTDGVYIPVGEALVDADGENYEYSLYSKAKKFYSQSPSAGFELLRFGRVINTEHETLVPADAPLWMTVNYPGGKGVVNLADATITKFSDADFPHWTGWQLIDDDTDSNSQCNSTAIQKWQEEGQFGQVRSRLICHFPLEWEKSTVDARFSWLKSGSDEHDPMSDEDYNQFKAHSEALCFDTGALGRGRLWHFNPTEFIRHFRKCGWLDCELIEKVMTSGAKRTSEKIKEKVGYYYVDINIIMRKYNILDHNRISHFLGQGAVESGCLLSMQEVSQYQVIKKGKKVGGAIVAKSTWNEGEKLGHWYGAIDAEVDEYFFGVKYNSKGTKIAGSYSWLNGNCGDIDAQKFRGRGFKMLTGLDTYSSYWVYRGWLSQEDFDAYWWDDPEYKKRHAGRMKKKPPRIESPHKVTENGYNCIDTGGFFISCFKKNVLKMIDSDLPGTTDDSRVVSKVTSAINGADKGLNQRKRFTKIAKEALGDEI
jgi:predicted chitinase